MAPPIEAFPVSELENRINVQTNGRRRKGGDIDLHKCELLELLQYECGLKGSEKDRRAVIQCAPVVKLFRRYAPLLPSLYKIWSQLAYRCAGGLIVETTAWDGEN